MLMVDSRGVELWFWGGKEEGGEREESEERAEHREKSIEAMWSTRKARQRRGVRCS